MGIDSFAGGVFMRSEQCPQSSWADETLKEEHKNCIVYISVESDEEDSKAPQPFICGDRVYYCLDEMISDLIWQLMIVFPFARDLRLSYLPLREQ